MLRGSLLIATVRILVAVGWAAGAADGFEAGGSLSARGEQDCHERQQHRDLALHDRFTTNAGPRSRNSETRRAKASGRSWAIRWPAAYTYTRWQSGMRSA